jgi:hypothetical protein
VKEPEFQRCLCPLPSQQSSLDLKGWGTLFGLAASIATVYMAFRD